MQNLNARIDSFKSRGRRAGFPHPTTTHPNLSPDRLARAGFYFAPEKKGDDTAVCFCCNSALGGWEPEDDPYAEHVRKDCAYADVVCRPAVEKAGGSSQQPDYPPESSEMTERRRQTFKDWWPHKAKRGWKPTVDAMAKAGFYYAATEGSDDMVQCAYCGYAAEGWEAEDDPYALHLARNADCRFFMGQGLTEAIEEPPAPKSKAKGRQTKAGATRGRATRAGTVASEAGTYIEAVAEPETADLVDEDAEPSAQSASTATAKRRGRKPRATTATMTTTTTVKKARKPRGKKAADAAASEVAESEADTDVAEPTAPAPPESDIVVLVQESETEQEAPEAPKAKKRGRPRKSEVARRATAAAGSAARNAEDPEATPSSEAQPKQSSRSAPASRRVKAPTGGSQIEKPLPALPRETEIASGSSTENQLKAFANLPPTSPWDTPGVAKASAIQSSSGPASLDVPTPKAQRPTRPLRSSPRTNLPREVLDRSIEAGAKGARQVLSDLVNSPLTNVLSPTAAQATPKASQSGQPPAEADLMAPLTEEQKKMTLEDLIRLEFANGRDRMKAQGEEMIRTWQEKAAEDRRRIAAL